METPRVYVASLAAYNAGMLHGEWIDAVDADDMETAAQAMVSASPIPGEEWAIHDSDGFYGIEVGEYDSFERVAAIGAWLETLGGQAAAGGAWFAGDTSTDVDSLEADFEDAYRGEFDSERDYAYSHAEDVLEMDSWPETAQTYFDCDAFARDLFSSDFWSTSSGGGVYVFRNV